MIDKKSEKWKSAPLYVKAGLLCIGTRRSAMAFEIGTMIFALLCIFGGFLFTPLFVGSFFFASAYWYAVSIRWVDNSGLWEVA